MRRPGLQTLILGRMTPIVLRVREARKRKGWTQAQLASHAGVRRATISQLESGRTQRVNLAVLEKVAKALGVPMLRLLREQRTKGDTP